MSSNFSASVICKRQGKRWREYRRRTDSKSGLICHTCSYCPRLGSSLYPLFCGSFLFVCFVFPQRMKAEGRDVLSKHTLSGFSSFDYCLQGSGIKDHCVGINREQRGLLGNVTSWAESVTP